MFMKTECNGATTSLIKKTYEEDEIFFSTKKMQVVVKLEWQIVRNEIQKIVEIQNFY